MKKRLSGCSECGDDTAILTQVSSGPEVILLCTDCYNLNIQMKHKTILAMKKKKTKKLKTKKTEPNSYGLGKFNYMIFKFLCSRFKLK